MDKYDDFIEKSKWTELLHSLPTDKPKGFLFPSTSAMDSCVSVGTRINSRGIEDRVFSFSMDYAHRILTVTAKARV